MYQHLIILYVFLSHYNPFSYLWYRYDPSTYNHRTGIQFKSICQILGPIFIKIFQGIAYRSDLFPPEIIEKLVDLVDTVDTEPNLISKVQIENLKNIRLLGSGSIAQVYYSELNEQKFAIKVKRNNIRNSILSNKQIIDSWLYIYNYFYPSDNVIQRFNEYFEGIIIQTDFTDEIKNQKLYLNIISELNLSMIHIPKIHDELCSDEYIVMEWIDGIKLSEELCNIRNIEKDKLLNEIVKFFMNPLMDYDLIHGDLHPGNMLIDKDNKLWILDFGIVFTIDPDTQVNYMQFLKYLKKRDKSKILSWYTSHFMCSNFVTSSEFEKEAKEIIDNYTSSKDYLIHHMMYYLIQLTRKHKYKLKEDFMKIEISKHTAMSIILLIDKDFDITGYIVDLCGN